MICCTICIFLTIGMSTQTEYGVGIDLWMFFIETKKLWAIVHFFNWFIEHDFFLFFVFFCRWAWRVSQYGPECHTYCTYCYWPFPATLKGNKVLVVLIDHFTKWSEAFAVPNQEARTIARMLVTEIISWYSIPKELLRDRGSNFLSKIVAEVCELFKVKKLATTAYNPKCNGGVERHQRIIQSVTGE